MLQLFFCFGEVIVVECLRVYFYEQNYCVQQEEDLCCLCLFQCKWYDDLDIKLQYLVDILYSYVVIFLGLGVVCFCSVLVFMQRKVYGCVCYYKEVSDSQMLQFYCEQILDLKLKRVFCVFYVVQYSCVVYDCKVDLEQVEEVMEVVVVVFRVEVGDMRGEFDSWEDVMFGVVEMVLFGLGLFVGIGERFNGWRSIFWYRCGLVIVCIVRKLVDVFWISLNGL